MKRISPVLLYSGLIMILIVAFGAIWPDSFGRITGNFSDNITQFFGWYYLMLTTALVFFAIFLVLSPIGKLKLGQYNDEPEFNTLSWLAMLFSAGMGIGLVFYGAYEPLAHFMAPPEADPETTQAAIESMQWTLHHYGFHPWAMYGIVALALAYFQFRRGEKGLLSSTLRPLFGNRVDGGLGNSVDVLATFATVIGVAVSLGVGTLQINGGLNYLFEVPNNTMTQFIIIVIITVLFSISAWTGLSKGIQYLSNTNMILAFILLTLVIILGPTLLIFDTISSTMGSYLQNFLHNSLDVAPYSEHKKDWLGTWTIYYWGWWMSWSPFVGIFIARVSRGRTVRQFLMAVILVPTAFALVWFSTFGMTGITALQSSPGIGSLPPETQLFGVFSQLPFSMILSIIAVFMVAIFFITSADSATFVLGMQTSYGTLQPSSKVKLFWGLALSAIAFILLIAGGETGLDALQAAAIISALPFSIVVIMMAIAFFKDANAERKYFGLTITPDKERVATYKESSYEEHQKRLDNYQTENE